MNLVTSISGDPKQNMVLVLDDGSKLSLSLAYFSNQQGWFYSITYGTFILNLRRIVTNPNMLRAFRKIIPFGLACIIPDGYEPIYLNDFVSKRAFLYLMNQDDVLRSESLIQNG